MTIFNATDFKETTDQNENSVFGLIIPDKAVYAIIAVGGALLLTLCCICCMIICICARRRRKRRSLITKINDVIRVNSTDDCDDYYVNYDSNKPILIQNSQQLTHVIGPEHLSRSSDYSSINIMARDVGDSGIVQSNSEPSSANNFHGVDGTRVRYTDIMSLNPPQKSEVPDAKENYHSYLDGHHVNTLKRSEIMVKNKEVDSKNGGVWTRDGEEVQIHLKISGEEDRLEMIQEAIILSQLKHTNIIKFYGILKDDLCVTIIEEDLPHTLKSYLGDLRFKKAKQALRGTAKILLTFCQQVALGMKYISDNDFIHGNLMACNVMVSSTNECKITDFSMTHAASNSQGQEVRDRVAVKWNALEVIENGMFSSASDVWSFGSLLYEVWSLGRDPFEGESNINVVGLIVQGRRLAPPSGCPRAMYELMIQSWNPNVFERPSFSELVLNLTRPDVTLLHVPTELIEAHPDCLKVGMPLTVGKLMYQDLQLAYCT